jgi:hypothetical protein
MTSPMTAAGPVPAEPARCSSTEPRSRKAVSSERSAASSSADEGADVGRKEGTPVSEDYQVPFKFIGRIERVTIEVENPSPAEQQAYDEADANAKLEKDLSD